MSLSVSLGVLLTKALVSHLLGENIYSGMFADVSDLLLERMGHDRQTRAMNRQVKVLADQVGTNVGAMFKKEVTGLKKDTQEIVVRAVGDTLQPLSVELLVATRLESDVLMRSLLDQTTVRRTLSQQEEDLYRRLLREVCESLVKEAPDFPKLLSAALQRLFKQQHALESKHQELDHKQDVLHAELALWNKQLSEADARHEADYRKTLIEKLDRLEFLGIPDHDKSINQQRLSSAYVSLQLDRQPDWVDDTSDDEQSFGLSEVAFKDSNQRLIRIDRLPEGPRDAADVVANNPRLIIRGEAGSGKSTLLRWIAVRLANEDCDQKAPALLPYARLLPVFIPLRNFAHGMPNLAQCLHEMNKLFSSGLIEWLERQLKDGRGIILIDALDELPRAQRPAALEWLQDWMRQYPLARFIITSRPTALDSDPTQHQREHWAEWREWVVGAGFVEAAVPRLSLSEVKYLIDRWFTALAEAERDHTIKTHILTLPPQLHDVLTYRPALAKLATNPLLCAMLCAVYYERGDNLPSQRTKLYKVCIDLLLNDRDRGRGIQPDEYYPKLEDEQKLSLIQKIAYWMQTNEYSSISWNEADERFSDFSKHIYLATPTTGQRIRELFVDRTALVHTPTKETLEFVHRSFQEYLVALEAVETKNIRFLSTKASNDQWRETIILAAGLLRHDKDRITLFKALINKGDEAVRRKAHYHLLALACLETSGNLIGADDPLRQAIIDRAQRLLPPNDEATAKLLASGGDPLVPLLEPQESYTYEQAAFCVTTLAEIGSSAALEMLAEYAKRYGSDDEAYQVCNTLGQVWDRFDQRRYADRVLMYVKKLRLKELPVGNGNPLLPNLTQIDLNLTHVSDLSFLRHVPNLTHLYLGFTQVSDLIFLRHVPNLTQLFLWKTLVSDLSFLRHVPNLTQLDIRGTQVSDLSALCHVPNLTQLYISDTKVSDLIFLRHVPNLTQLFLWKTLVSDLSFLRHVPNLTQLDIMGTQVSDLSALCHVPNLTQLYISDTKVSDLSFLRHVPNLTHLYLGFTQVSDLIFLRHVPNLTGLDLSGTQVSDLSFLRHVPNLTQLDIRGTQVSDLSALCHVPNLTQLYLSEDHELDLSPIQDRIDSGQLEIRLLRL